MTQSELPLYPKLSSIYNKIMQLAIAIVLIIVLLNVMVYSHQANNKTINHHFNIIGKQYSEQLASIADILLAKKDTKVIDKYLNSLTHVDSIKSVTFYDYTGRTLYKSSSADSMNELFGVVKTRKNRSEHFVPFVAEIRDDNLTGYVRVTFDKESLIEELVISNDETADLYRIMLVLAGIVGFLLTRGTNRFSRQGFRLSMKK